MNQLRNLLHLLAVVIPFLAILIIERVIGVPLVSLNWLDLFRTRLHWHGQIMLWVGMSLLISLVMAWPIAVSAAVLLGYWAVMLVTGHRPKSMVVVNLILLLVSYLWLKVPLSWSSVAFLAIQLAGSYFVFHYDQNHTLMA